MKNIVAGDDRLLTFTSLDYSGNAADITGYGITCLITNSTGSITKTVGSGITITDAPNGVAEIQIDAADWAPWANIETSQKLLVEIQTTDGAGRINTPVQENWVVLPQGIVA